MLSNELPSLSQSQKQTLDELVWDLTRITDQRFRAALYTTINQIDEDFDSAQTIQKIKSLEPLAKQIPINIQCFQAMHVLKLIQYYFIRSGFNNRVPVAHLGENFCFRMTLYYTIIQGWSILVFFVETITTSNANEKSYSLIFVRQLVNYYRPTFLMVNTRTNISELTKYTLVLNIQSNLRAWFHILNYAKLNLVQTGTLQQLYLEQQDFSSILNLQRYSRLQQQF
ncbi:Hypothetical_protein [Hexamita inflata]|uniref:Hypothetical_protein n=1 Tax=Hexamita inflata TaxID=28002 RepID=A0AA86RA81_9EUKA|nr:Hypothetical protein HINF_LOCUS61310 [Hexamita inflata]